MGLPYGAISLAASNGASIRELLKLSGHKSEAGLRIYDQSSIEVNNAVSYL